MRYFDDGAVGLSIEPLIGAVRLLAAKPSQVTSHTGSKFRGHQNQPFAMPCGCAVTWADRFAQRL